MRSTSAAQREGGIRNLVLKKEWGGARGPAPGLLEGLELQNSCSVFQEKLEVSEDSARSWSPSESSTERPEKCQRSKKQTRLTISLLFGFAKKKARSMIASINH